jgi:hypothetical protein
MGLERNLRALTKREAFAPFASRECWIMIVASI